LSSYRISYRKLVEIGFEKLAVRPAVIVSGTYLERFKPAGTKSKETPGEENPKILKSGFDWIKMLGRGDLIAEIAEVPRRDGEGERTAVRAPEMYTSGENCRSTLPPEIKSPFDVNHNYI